MTFKSNRPSKRLKKKIRKYRMKNELISHIGIAVLDLEESITKYTLLTGDQNPFITEVPDQKVKVAIFSADIENLPGGRIELLAPTSSESPIAKFLDKRGEGLHHICIYVENIEKKLSELKSSGAKLIDEIPRIGAEGNRIAFVHPKSSNGVLIELEEVA